MWVLMQFELTLQSTAVCSTNEIGKKSEPGAVATGRGLKFSKDFALLSCVLKLESLAGRYRSRF